jgi:hypothetical protein
MVLPDLPKGMRMYLNVKGFIYNILQEVIPKRSKTVKRYIFKQPRVPDPIMFQFYCRPLVIDSSI